MPSAVEAQSLNHWTTKEVPPLIVLKSIDQPFCRMSFNLGLSNVFFMS